MANQYIKIGQRPRYRLLPGGARSSYLASGYLAVEDSVVRFFMAALAVVFVFGQGAAVAADQPDLIFKKSTVFKWLTPNDKLATYGLDDPEVEGVACHFTVPERGGFKGWIGVAEEVSDISLACRQIGPIKFKAKFEQGEDVFRQRRSLFFKKMQIVRGCESSATYWSIWSIATGSSKARPRIRPPACRSCPGADRVTWPSAGIGSRNNHGCIRRRYWAILLPGKRPQLVNGACHADRSAAAVREHRCRRHAACGGQSPA
jgi:CreA protein